LPPLAERQRTAKTKRIDGDNLDTFNTRYKVATNKGLPHDQAMVEAARKTKTREWARAAGFNNINSRKQRARPAHPMPQFATTSEKAPRQNATSFAPFHRELLQRTGRAVERLGRQANASNVRRNVNQRPIVRSGAYRHGTLTRPSKGVWAQPGSFRGNLMHGEGEYAIPARVPPENIRR
jgi:hypothetical protein